MFIINNKHKSPFFMLKKSLLLRINRRASKANNGLRLKEVNVMYKTHVSVIIFQNPQLYNIISLTSCHYRLCLNRLSYY